MQCRATSGGTRDRLGLADREQPRSRRVAARATVCGLAEDRQVDLVRRPRGRVVHHSGRHAAGMAAERLWGRIRGLRGRAHRQRRVPRHRPGRPQAHRRRAADLRRRRRAGGAGPAGQPARRGLWPPPTTPRDAKLEAHHPVPSGAGFFHGSGAGFIAATASRCYRHPIWRLKPQSGPIRASATARIADRHTRSRMGQDLAPVRGVRCV